MANWRDPNDPNYKAFRDFTESGGFGSFAGWHGADSFETTDNNRVPSGGYHKSGEYYVVDGTDERRIPPGYEVIGKDDPVAEAEGDSGYRQIPGRIYAKRSAAPQAAPTPAAETPEPYEIDTDAIGRAKDLAAKAKDQYASSIPSLDPTRDPYSSAMAYGSEMQRSLLDGQAMFRANAKANTTEIGEASKSAASRFFGTVKDIEVPDWTKYKA